MTNTEFEKYSDKKRSALFEQSELDIPVQITKENLKIAKDTVKDMTINLENLFKEDCRCCGKELCVHHSNILRTLDRIRLGIANIYETTQDSEVYYLSIKDRKILGVNGLDKVIRKNRNDAQDNIINTFDMGLLSYLFEDSPKNVGSDETNIAKQNEKLSLTEILSRDMQWINEEQKINENLEKNILLPICLGRLTENMASFENELNKRKELLYNWQLKIKTISEIINSYDPLYFKDQSHIIKIYKNYELVEEEFINNLRNLSDDLNEWINSNLTLVKNHFSEQYSLLSEENSGCVILSKKRNYGLNYMAAIERMDLEKFLEAEETAEDTLRETIIGLFKLQLGQEDDSIMGDWFNTFNEKNFDENWKADVGLIDKVDDNFILLKNTYNYLKKINKINISTSFKANKTEDNKKIVGMFKEYMSLKELYFDVIFSRINQKIDDYHKDLEIRNLKENNDLFVRLASLSKDDSKLKIEFTKKAEAKEFMYKLRTEYNFPQEKAMEEVSKRILNKIEENDISGLITYVEHAFEAFVGLRWEFRTKAIEYGEKILERIDQLPDEKNAVKTAMFFYELGNEKKGITILERFLEEGGAV